MISARRKQDGNPFRKNLEWARNLWSEQFDRRQIESLRALSERYFFTVGIGDLQFLDGRWYVTHAGLLRLSSRRRCRGIRTILVDGLSDPAVNRWVFKATVYTTRGSKGFVGYGDADPSNVSPLVRGAEMRVAETRAVNRALRKAYGIGLCSVEELGSFSCSTASPPAKPNGSHPAAGNGSSNGQPRLRDRLCLLIRQHHLDSNQVKSYAAEYCGTQALREASREMVEAFINHLGEWAMKDKEGLLAKLQSFTPAPEVHA
jgi:hypothetical protein